MSEPTQAASDASKMIYDGSFDLTFLRDGETVGATGDHDGSCWVEQKTGPNTCRGMRLDKGDVLARNDCGELYAYTPSEPTITLPLSRVRLVAFQWCDDNCGGPENGHKPLCIVPDLTQGARDA